MPTGSPRELATLSIVIAECRTARPKRGRHGNANDQHQLALSTGHAFAFLPAGAIAKLAPTSLLQTSDRQYLWFTASALRPRRSASVV